MNLPEQWKRVKRTFDQFLMATNRADQSDPVNNALLVMTIGQRGNDICDPPRQIEALLGNCHVMFYFRFRQSSIRRKMMHQSCFKFKYWQSYDNVNVNNLKSMRKTVWKIILVSSYRDIQSKSIIFMFVTGVCLNKMLFCTWKEAF